MGQLYWSQTRPAAPGVVNHVDLALPEGHALYSSPAISPDGRIVAFVSAGQNERPSLYVRELTKNFSLRPIPETEDADSPFFSPDGRSIAFFARGQLLRVSLDGGLPVPVAPAPAPLGGTWGDDGSIVFTPTLSRGLVRVTLKDGPPETLIRPDGRSTYAVTYPTFLPGARELLFSAWGMNVNVERLTLADGKRFPVVAMFASNALHAGSGHVLFGSLLSIFKSELLAVALLPTDAGGGAAPVLSGVFVDTRAGRFWVDTVRTGTLVYAAGDVSRTTLVQVDQAGRIVETYPGNGHYETPAVSRDGERVAYTRDGRIYVQSLRRRGETLLTEETGAASKFTERTPTWHPDGVHILYMSNRRGNWDLYTKNASGAEMAQPVVEKDGDQLFPSMRRDGTLLFVESHPEMGRDIWLQTPDGKQHEWLATSKNEYWPTFSPNGELIAYASDQSERFEVYVSPVSDPNTRHQISTEGGVYPVWSPNGGCVFFRQGTRFLAADVHPDGSAAGKPRPLFDGGWPLGTSAGLPLGRTSINRNGFAVLPDGEHFLMIRAEPAAIPTRLHVVFNWLEELKSKMPTKK